MAYRGDITQLVLLTSQNLAQDAAHDLARSCLGQIGNDMYGLGSSEGADTPADLQDEVLTKTVICRVAVLEGNEGVNTLAGKLVGNADDSGFGNGGMLEKCCLDLRRRKTVARDVDHIVDSATNPVESFMVTTGAVSGKLEGVSMKYERRLPG